MSAPVVRLCVDYLSKLPDYSAESASRFRTTPRPSTFADNVGGCLVQAMEPELKTAAAFGSPADDHPHRRPARGGSHG